MNAKFKQIVPGVLVGLLVAIMPSINVLPVSTDAFTDNLYRRKSVSSDIIIVGVDDNSLNLKQGLGKFSNWDIEYFTQAIRNISAQNPKTLTIDFFFDSDVSKVTPLDLNSLNQGVNQSSTSKERLEVYEDFLVNHTTPGYSPKYSELAAELQKYSNTVLIAFSQDESLLLPFYELARSATIGIASTVIDSTDTLRHSIPYFILGDQSYPNMALATAKLALGLDPYDPTNLELPTDSQGLFYVNFFGQPNSFKHISFVDVYRGNFEPGTFTDKIVLIGPTSSKQFHDEYVVPTSENSLMSGVEFRANEIQTILEEKFLLPQGKTGQILTIIAITAILATALTFTNILIGSLIALASLGLYYVAAQMAFNSGTILNMVYPFLAIILTYLTTIAYKYFVTDKSKRKIKGAFGRYVNKSLVDQIAENPDQVKLGGQNREVTVFFSDIKNSTTYSEKIAIEAWVSQINEYFTAMENIIMQSGGTLDKYEGDAIMAFWNAPIEQPDHQIRAYKAALSMKQSLSQLHQKWQKEGKPLIEFRIGINTGIAIVGNFGSENRLDYTAMGDTVNTASRLESSANKTYGTQICIAGLKPEQISQLPVREIDTVLLPGKKEPVTLYELYEDSQKQTAETYQKALALYKQKQFAEALQIFQSLPDDTPATIMAARCQTLSQGQAVADLNTETMVYSIEHK